MIAVAERDLCPCDSGAPYGRCCGGLHRGATAPNPEALMRSRYSAFVLGMKDYLLASWHPQTRPRAADFDPGDLHTRWLGLRVLRTEIVNADKGFVEFVARYRVGGQSAVRLHETSRFVREDGVWFYVDGVFNDAKRS